MKCSQGASALFLASLLLVGRVQAAGARQKAAKPRVTYGFDNLVLARHWPPSICKAQFCNQGTFNLFTIHGLWPALKNGSLVTACPTNITFDKSNLWEAQRGRMSCEWRNFQGPNDQLWGQQWAQHGSCALPLFTNLTAYFGYALALHEQYDINEALVRAGINPLIAQRITPRQLQGILEQRWNISTAVVCGGGNIVEVRTCFTPALKAIDCPAGTAGNTCPTAAQELPYSGSTQIPAACKYYFDGIPPGTNPASVRRPPPPGPPSAAYTAAAMPAALVLLLAMASLLIGAL